MVYALSHCLWRSIISLPDLKQQQQGKPEHLPKTTQVHFKKIIMAHASEGICLSLCMESHQHTETEAFSGSRKLHFTLALCIILKIATLRKHLRINCSWKKNLPNKKARFCKFPESSSLSQITVTSLKYTYVSWKINAKYLLSNGKRKIARISPLLTQKNVECFLILSLPLRLQEKTLH